MAIIVQKYGGSSVGDADRINHVATRIADSMQRGDMRIVVVSAMGDTTDDLIAMARQLNGEPSPREMDALLGTGELITAPLLAMALLSRGVDAISLTGLQAGIRTSTAHRKARIVDIVPSRIREEMALGKVVIVAGFQGVTDDLDMTTLGRGGSDTTAVAIAAAVGAEQCEIYSDVSGVFTADPRLVPTARLIPEISYEEMLEFAAVGATIIHPRAVEIGEAYSLPIWVRSTFDETEPGTCICREPQMENQPKVRGIAHEIDVAKVTLLHVPDRPGIAAVIFDALAHHHINVDAIVQNVGHDGSTDVSFTIAASDLSETRAAVAEIIPTIGASGVEATDDIAKVSIVGTGMLHTPGVAATMFATLADAGINIELISTSEIRITCFVAQHHVENAVQALHKAYALDAL